MPLVSPPIPNIVCETVGLENKLVYVISVFPTPYVHETKRRLQTRKADFDSGGVLQNLKDPISYTEYTVFVRENENIMPASGNVRRALEVSKGFDLVVLNENIKFELLHNLKHLLTKLNNRVTSPTLFYRSFIENVPLAWGKYLQVDKKYVRRFVIAATYPLGVSLLLSSQHVDFAIRSGKYLKYSFEQGKYTTSEFLTRLQELQLNTRILRVRLENYNFDNLFEKYGSTSKDEGFVEIRCNDFGQIAATLGTFENVINLSKGLLAYLEGDKSALEKIRLNHLTPFRDEAEIMDKGYPTQEEVLGWVNLWDE